MGESKDHAERLHESTASVSPLASPASSGAAAESSPLRWRHRLLRWAFHLYFRLTRGMTMGVRAVVLKDETQVFLVRHTYIPGWHLPGGGIEAGQSTREALTMELAEEGHITLTAEPQLFGIYQNREAAPRDHVLLYVVRDFVQEKPRLADYELAETGFFALNALPEGTTAATRRRLQEVLERRAPPMTW